MSLFGNLFKESSSDNSENKKTESMNSKPKQNPQVLNLEKGGILNLTKVSSELNKMRASAGWDVVAHGRDYDLDLCAYLIDQNKRILDTVYYGDKHSRRSPIWLDGDNLTGDGDGDDENIYVTLNDVDSNIHEIYFAVIIYEGSSRKQSFEGVRNAYVRLVDVETNDEVCRYNLSNDGGSNTAVVVAKLYRTGEEWNFQAIGEYSRNSISSLKNDL